MPPCGVTPRSAAPDDLLELPEYSYSTLLSAMRIRHARYEPYTWIGPVLVSVNPCADLGSFSQAMMKRYMESPKPCEVPHPFAVVGRALRGLQNGDGSSSAAVLVTGESGAGKTEAVKAMLSFLIARQGARNARVCDSLVGSTQALEAFGNARTLQNSNSSRFGKLAEVSLDAQTGKVEGAVIVPYMLEASRMTHRACGERNFHICYALRDALERTARGLAFTRLGEAAASVAGTEEAQAALRNAPSGFWGRAALWPEWCSLAERCCCGSGSGLARSPYLLDDGDARHAGKACAGPVRFDDIVGSMRAVGLEDEEILSCMQLVAAVLMLGNVTPTVVEADGCARGGARNDHEGGAAEAAEPADDALRKVGEMLAISESELAAFLGTKAIDTPGGRITQPRTCREATTLRDSVARELYSALFSWLVRRVAAAAAPPPAQELCPEAEVRRRVAMLDIYGFEVCQTNGLEQLLINYCNERLQALFNMQLFATEAQDYRAEGVPAELFTEMFQTHELIALPLLEGGGNGPWRAPGLFALVDDEARCRFNDGSAAALRSRMDSSFSDSAAYKAGRREATVFAVAHFAGDVAYDSKSFVESNANAARPEILAFFGGATAWDFVRGVVATRVETPEAKGMQPEFSQGGRRRQLFGRTVIQAFRTELDELIRSLEADGTQCHYVRCLKPNPSLRPAVFDTDAMLRQCRYSGLLETVHIRQHGFPHRQPVLKFVERYASVVWPADCAELFRRRSTAGMQDWGRAELRAWATSMVTLAEQWCGVTKGEIFVGRTKVFMRAAASAHLEAELLERSLAAMKVQARLRTSHLRARFLAIQSATLLIQASIRDYLTRKVIRCIRGVIRLQARFRGIRARQEFRRRFAERWAAIAIQRWIRRLLFPPQSWDAEGSPVATQQRRRKLQRLADEASAAVAEAAAAVAAATRVVHGSSPRTQRPEMPPQASADDEFASGGLSCFGDPCYGASAPDAYQPHLLASPAVSSKAAQSSPERQWRSPSKQQEDLAASAALAQLEFEAEQLAELEARKAHWDASLMAHQSKMSEVQAQFEALRAERVRMLHQLNVRASAVGPSSPQGGAPRARQRTHAAGGAVWRPPGPGGADTLACRARAIAAFAPVLGREAPPPAQERRFAGGAHRETEAGSGRWGGGVVHATGMAARSSSKDRFPLMSPSASRGAAGRHRSGAQDGGAATGASRSPRGHTDADPGSAPPSAGPAPLIPETGTTPMSHSVSVGRDAGETPQRSMMSRSSTMPSSRGRRAPGSAGDVGRGSRLTPCATSRRSQQGGLLEELFERCGKISDIQGRILLQGSVGQEPLWDEPGHTAGSGSCAPPARAPARGGGIAPRAPVLSRGYGGRPHEALAHAGSARSLGSSGARSRPGAGTPGPPTTPPPPWPPAPCTGGSRSHRPLGDSRQSASASTPLLCCTPPTRRNVVLGASASSARRPAQKAPASAQQRRASPCGGDGRSAGHSPGRSAELPRSAHGSPAPRRVARAAR